MPLKLMDKTVRSPRPRTTKLVGNGDDLHEANGRFKKGHQKVPGSGVVPGKPRPIGKLLLNSFVEACSLVGYDRDVAVKTKDGKPLLDKKGNPVYDETKRILGLIPYLQRTAELHRPETLAIIGKILAPLVHNLQLNIGEDAPSEKHRPSREELERQLTHWGIPVNIFHGDEGRRPMKLMEHERLGRERKDDE